MDLQVDRWEPCPSKPGHIIVNVGDMLQYWSDGLLKSNYHRVRLPQEGEPLVCPQIIRFKTHSLLLTQCQTHSRRQAQHSIAISSSVMARTVLEGMMTVHSALRLMRLPSAESYQSRRKWFLLHALQSMQKEYERQGDVQAERYTIAWFVWPPDGAVIQGPKKRYPPTTMRDFMKVRASLKAVPHFYCALDTCFHRSLLHKCTPQVR